MHLTGDVAVGDCRRDGWGQIEGRTENRTPFRVLADTCTLNAGISQIDCHIQFVQKITLLRSVKHIIDIV